MFANDVAGDTLPDIVGQFYPAVSFGVGSGSSVAVKTKFMKNGGAFRYPPDGVSRRAKAR